VSSLFVSDGEFLTHFLNQNLAAGSGACVPDNNDKGADDE